MKLPLLGVLVTTSVAACNLMDRHQPQTRTRTIAFDNVYGAVKTLPVYVWVDGGGEQSARATCDAKTCSVKLPLTNARHELVIVVEVNGRRSTETYVTLDTSRLP